MKMFQSALGVAIVSCWLVRDASGQPPRGRADDPPPSAGRRLDRDRGGQHMRRPPEGDRQRRPRDRDRDQGFNPDWWHEGAPDRDRRPPRRDRDDDQWFDPGWWHDWPPDRDRRPPRRGDDDRGADRGRWRGWLPDRDWGRRAERWFWPRDDYPRRTPRAEPAALGVHVRDSRIGLQVSGVVPGSPARRAGLRAGDYLLSLDGERLWDRAGLYEKLRRLDPGDYVRLRFLRRDSIRRAGVVLQSRREVF